MSYKCFGQNMLNGERSYFNTIYCFKNDPYLYFLEPHNFRNSMEMRYESFVIIFFLLIFLGVVISGFKQIYADLCVYVQEDRVIQILF